MGLGWVKTFLLVFHQQWRIVKKRAPVKAKKTPPLQILAGAGGSGGEFHHLSSPAIWIGLRYYQQGKPFFREKNSKQWVVVVSLFPYPYSDILKLKITLFYACEFTNHFKEHSQVLKDGLHILNFLFLNIWNAKNRIWLKALPGVLVLYSRSSRPSMTDRSYGRKVWQEKAMHRIVKSQACHLRLFRENFTPLYCSILPVTAA